MGVPPPLHTLRTVSCCETKKKTLSETTTCTHTAKHLMNFVTGNFSCNVGKAKHKEKIFEPQDPKKHSILGLFYAGYSDLFLDSQKLAIVIDFRIFQHKTFRTLNFCPLACPTNGPNQVGKKKPESTPHFPTWKNMRKMCKYAENMHSVLSSGRDFNEYIMYENQILFVEICVGLTRESKSSLQGRGQRTLLSVEGEI